MKNPTKIKWQGSAADEKTTELSKLVHELRQHIDLEKLIGLNAEALNEHGGSGHFWGHVQKSAQDDIALTVCKIFEEETDRYGRSSIPAIIDELASGPHPERLEDGVTRFCGSWGIRRDGADVKASLDISRRKFQADHEASFTRLKLLRNKKVAHSQYPVPQIAALPSHAEYDLIFKFSDEMRRLLADIFSDGELHLLPIDPFVSRGLVALLKKLGVEDPKDDFPD